MCICGKPETLGVVHSMDVPCFSYQPPDYRADAFAREFFIAAILGNKAAADGASEKLLRYVLSVPPLMEAAVKSPSASNVRKQTEDPAE
jgi:hypothetical protein